MLILAAALSILVVGAGTANVPEEGAAVPPAASQVQDDAGPRGFTIAPGSYFDTADEVEMERRLRRSFELMDFDGDGYIAGREAPMATSGYIDGNGHMIQEQASTGLWIRRIDADGDGKVDWHEMRNHLLPTLLSQRR